MRPDTNGPADLPGPRLIAESPATRAAAALALRAARTDIAVLFEGESGVGKEVFARAVHAASARAAGPFVAVNCGALPETLVESILFGHERGAFTGASERREGRFAEADGGVLFLDEIGELPLAAQVKLLRALQSREIDPIGAARPRPVDIRLICATNRDLRREVAAGRFREDLFYRIAAFPVRIPPLRERPEDVEPLARATLARLAAAEGRRPVDLGPDALAALRVRPWPGNVRELENVLHRALVLCEGGALTAAHVGEPAPPAAPDAPEPSERTLAEVEAEHIRAVFARCGGAVAETARRLGIGRSTLYRKLQALGLSRDAR
jgi:DNA-binding NtrC family response regulator